MQMGYFSLLIQTLQLFPFDETQDYKLHISQCHALCGYFSSTLGRFFDTHFRPDNEASSNSHSNREFFRRWNSLSVLYHWTLSRWWSSRKEHRSSGESVGHDYGMSAILTELKSTPHAIEELYRVLKEAQFFLCTCSNEDWCRSALSLGMGLQSTLACDVHIHDLMWCIAGLQLCLHNARGVELESRARFTCKSIIKCNAEMAAMADCGYESLRRDLNQLREDLQCLKAKYDAMSVVRKMILHTHEKLKFETAQFLLKKLDSQSQSSLSPVVSNPPQSLFIPYHDMNFQSHPRVVSVGRSTQIIEALWLGMRVAVKQFDSSSCKQDFENEIAVRTQLQNPFFLQYFGWSQNAQDCKRFVVLEHLTTSLQSLVEMKQENQINSVLRLPVLVDLMLQVARGMDCMHGKKIIHGSLRPCSIMIELLSSSKELKEEGYGRVKLCDFNFGCETFLQEVTPYRAPELQYMQVEGGREAGFKGDVYAFAMTFAYALTGQEPLGTAISGTVLQDLLSQGARPDLPASCPKFLRDLIQLCWSENPSSRPSFSCIAMALRQLKLLLMKTIPKQWSERQEQREALLSTPVMTYQELCMATHNFTDTFPCISSELIYHGILSDGSDVLIQKKRSQLDEGVIWAEALQVMGLRHSNVSHLRAICIHGSQSWFIYKCNGVQGSLDKWMADEEHSSALDAMACFRVVLGVACGLQYIHSQDMLHSVSASNVLLTKEFEPQILVDASAGQEGIVSDDDEDNAMEHLRLIDLLRFGEFVRQVVAYLSRHGAVTSGSMEAYHMAMLKDVEGFCLNSGSARMDEVIDMLELHNDFDIQLNSDITEMLETSDLSTMAAPFYMSEPI